MPLLPFTLPASSGGHSLFDADTGGYDFSIGGYGFRYATSKDFPYRRYTEPTTVRRFDESNEPGEQTLSPLPWIKAQSSFHAGAGQLNLEQGLSQFQYQQEEVAHIRYDMSFGVDPWTVGELKRLPDAINIDGTWSDAGAGQTVAIGNHMCVGLTADSDDAAMIGGMNGLSTVVWSSGITADPVVSAVSVPSGAQITSLCADGHNYYVLYTKTGGGCEIAKGVIGATAAPTVLYSLASVMSGVLGWSKERLIAGLGSSVYELDLSASAATALPTPKYTHPSGGRYTAISESPSGVLVAALVGAQASILQFSLDPQGAVPILTGGSTVAKLPPGETIYDIESYLGSFLGIATTAGVRVGTFDTYSGALTYGPLTVMAGPYGVRSLSGRDRFIYCGNGEAQADGSSGLARIDLSMKIDTGGRNAWAPDLRPASTVTHRDGDVFAVGLLPRAGRMVWLTSWAGLHLEGDGPGSDGEAWLRTSRVRYDTAEPKMFTLGRVHGNLTSSTLSVSAWIPSSDTMFPLGTFGPIAGSDAKVQFGLPGDLSDWIQLQFDLVGQTAVLNSYQVKALPAPQRQHIIQITANCFRQEMDRFNLEVTDPVPPRQRWMAVQDLEATGGRVRFVEFTNQGPVAEMVVIDQIEFDSTVAPSVEDDFGGFITFKLRTVM